MATYDYLKSKNGHKIQVESAKRDGAGKNIENTYAKQNGYYAQLTSGNADQLNSTIFVTDQVPYLFRTSGGDADIGNREYDKIIGCSLVVNQLAKELNATNNSIGFWYGVNHTVSYSDNTATITVTNSNSGIDFGTNATISFVQGHKYLIALNIKSSVSGRKIRPKLSASVSGQDVTLGTNNSIVQVVNFNIASSTSRFAILIYNSEVNDVFEISDYQIIDLTSMFGSTIDDYIYSLEQANTGAGVSWFRQYFQELYYPYNTGAIKNVQLISHDMVGFNQWDEEWENGSYDDNGNKSSSYPNNIRSKTPFRVLPNTTYYFSVTNAPTNTNVRKVFYDKNMNCISSTGGTSVNATFTTPNNACYMAFGMNAYYYSTYKNDICINLSWSGWRNGQYESYKKSSYPLDTTIELRGIPKLDADNHLYFDGDEYTYDGKVVRKYGVVDLGSLSWEYSSGSTRFYVPAPSNCKLPANNNTEANIRCSKYSVGTGNETATASLDKIIAIHTSLGICVRDSAYTDAATFKTAMSGVMLVYELANTTEETAEPYQEIQIVDDFGTEEYVVPTQDGWQIPVGHDTKYPANLRDKLQRLPDMPSVSQNVTETYVVNYNGTTKKCTFAEINAWLSSNGYEKQVDLSDQITDVAGLTYQFKKLYKIGNVLTLTIRAKNETGSQIAAGTTLFTLPSGAYQTTTIFHFNGGLGSSTSMFNFGNNGAEAVASNSAIPNNTTISIMVSYAVE